MPLFDNIKYINKDGSAKPTRYYSKKQEKKVAKDLNGKQTSNSGATRFGGKSDILLDNLFSLECKTKTSSSNSINIKKEWFEKLQEESLFNGTKYSAVVFNFGPNEKNYYIIDEYLFQDLIDYLNNKEY